MNSSVVSLQPSKLERELFKKWLFGNWESKKSGKQVAESSSSVKCKVGLYL